MVQGADIVGSEGGQLLSPTCPHIIVSGMVTSCFLPPQRRQRGKGLQLQHEQSKLDSEKIFSSEKKNEVVKH